MVKFKKIEMGTIFYFFLIPKIGFTSPTKDSWLDAMEFLEYFDFVLHGTFFDLYMEIASKLNHLKECNISNFLTSEKLLKLVDAFPKLPKLTLHGEMDDELLKLLASKSNESNPLEKLEFVPRIGFSINALEHFVKRATFVDESQIILKINAALPDVAEMFKRIDKHEVILLKQSKNNFEFKKIDENIRITVGILSNL
uniref:Uncharacterized protein n=1 Tax=Panagrolaimus sp. JU765 TaxID=591449 RepID=A0AC34RBN0_9BILA